MNYWTDDGLGGLVQEYVEARIKAYKRYQDLSQVSWSEVFAGSYTGMLDWLEYNGSVHWGLRWRIKKREVCKVHI